MLPSPKLQFDTLSSSKIGKMTEIGHILYCSFIYFKILSQSDQMLQKSFLGDIEIDWIAQRL
jgi:hypothetical protein